MTKRFIFCIVLVTLGYAITFAFPVRSIVGARSSQFAEKGGYTAADYVQDGLVAMWDGIENAGWGKHDSEATTWKDLIGSNDLTIYGNVLSNCISNIGLYLSAAGASFQIDGISTIEACHEYQGGSTPYGIIVNTGNVGTSRIGLVHYGAANGFQTYSNIFWAYPEIENQHAITLCGTTAQCYVNGNELQPVTHSADAWNNGSVTIIGGRPDGGFRVLANYFCIRFYNRVLTAAEIAANYAVDKERFNLP